MGFAVTCGPSPYRWRVETRPTGSRKPSDTGLHPNPFAVDVSETCAQAKLGRGWYAGALRGDHICQLKGTKVIKSLFASVPFASDNVLAASFRRCSAD